MSKCKIVVLSDIHHTDTIDESGIKLNQYAIPLLQKFGEYMNSDVHPDIVIMLGDMIDDEDDKVIDANKMKVVLDTLSKINAPIECIMGNHDIRPYDSREELAEYIGIPTHSRSIDINGYHLILIGLDVDTAYDKSMGCIPRTNTMFDRDLEWLKHDLESTTLPTIVCSHYGLLQDTFQYGYDWFVQHPDTAIYTNADSINKILQDSAKVVAVFTGHHHWTKTTIMNGIPYFSVGSMTENISKDGVPDGAYYIVDIDNKNTSVLDRNIRLDDK